MGKISQFLIFFLFPVIAFGQQVEVNAYFTQDSAKLGERVGYVLKVKHPEATQIIFPDSTFDYSPLVLLEKKTFMSSTSEGITQDSTIYYLSNFSLEPSIFLTLPVYELVRYDSVTYFPNEAELKLNLTLDSIPEQPIFQENNVYQSLKKSVNWIMVAILVGAILVLLGVLYALFAKRINKIWREQSEKRRWRQFEKKWKIKTAQLEESPAIEIADEVIGLWKGYMESITGLPIKEWTSSEISKKLDDYKVFESLRSIDMIIYAGKSLENDQSIDYLLQVAKEKYQENLTQIKHERAVS